MKRLRSFSADATERPLRKRGGYGACTRSEWEEPPQEVQVEGLEYVCSKDGLQIRCRTGRCAAKGGTTMQCKGQFQFRYGPLVQHIKAVHSGFARELEETRGQKQVSDWLVPRGAAPQSPPPSEPVPSEKPCPTIDIEALLKDYRLSHDCVDARLFCDVLGSIEVRFNDENNKVVVVVFVVDGYCCDLLWLLIVVVVVDCC